MARPPKKLPPHTQWHRNKIRVVVAVPKDLQADYGKKTIKVPLGISSPKTAATLAPAKVLEIKKGFADLRARRKLDELRDPAVRQAFAYRQEIAAARNAGQDIDAWVLQERGQEACERAGAKYGTATLETCADILAGRATPFEIGQEDFIRETYSNTRSASDARRIIGRYVGWTQDGNGRPTVEAADRRQAGRYVSWLRQGADLSDKSIGKELSFLSSYWNWLHARGITDADNPWRGQKIKAPGRRDKKAEPRPFTSEELRALFDGSPSDRLRDAMWMGALTGARIDELARLQVRDVEDGWLQLNVRERGKSDAARREVPVHPALERLLARLTADKKPEAWLLKVRAKEAPAGGSSAKRSDPLSKAFGHYRKRVGVNDREPGARQSNVTFHSFRRWFIQRARDAGQPRYAVRAVVGHQGDEDITMERYGGKPSESALRAVVESVGLPAGVEEPR